MTIFQVRMIGTGFEIDSFLVVFFFLNECFGFIFLGEYL